MYSRQKDESYTVNVPPNYSGNAFRTRRANVHITPERQTPPRQKDEKRIVREIAPAVEPERETEEIPIHETHDEQSIVAAKDLRSEQAASSLLSPLGSLGTEEILLIALALIIFQSGKDPDLALILLALLFIN
ncbi:MAG: hypothetical protein E7653_07425 [Ruminococcaceae bacterium]|nr:hypothetical protein [Oscillospiraceae bacterium]